MKRLRSRFLRLSTTERWFLIKAALLLEGIKLAMLLFPFRVLRRLVDRTASVPVGVRRSDRFSAERIGRVVQTVSRHVPGVKTCLVQALATQVLLARRGYPAVLYIGALKTDKGAIQAHAWVECEGEVVIGGDELERYTPITTLDRNRGSQRPNHIVGR
jgi:hypothetical protein